MCMVRYHINSYQISMSKYIILLLAITVAVLAQQQDCNTTHLQYFSKFSLGKQNELNITFTKIQQKIVSLNNVTYRKNDSATYKIGGIKPRFFYIDSNQSAEIIGNDTVVIMGGRVDVRFDFQWSKQGTGSTSGNGSANALSDQIDFSFELQIKDGFMIENLTDFEKVEFDEHGIQLFRVNPPTTSEEDLANLRILLNNHINVTSVKHQLEDEIDKYFNYYLNQSLYDDRRILDTHFEYVWNSTKGKLTVQYDMNATGVDVEPDGLTLTYKARIKDYANWKCEDSAPEMHWNPAVYGGVQEFITFDVYRNTLRYAIDGGHLDVDLDRRGWESRFFQFYAGDLYEVIPRVAQKFLASEIVTGSCKTSSRYLNLIKGGFDYFNVTMVYNCELGINRDKVTQFQINLTMAVQGRPNATHLDFYVINQTHNAQLIPYLDYKIQNPTLAQHMINHSLYRLWGHRVFGSGWKLYDRDYPHFAIDQKNHTVVYDSTHVDPKLSDMERMPNDKAHMDKLKKIMQEQVEQIVEF